MLTVCSFQWVSRKYVCPLKSGLPVTVVTIVTIMTIKMAGYDALIPKKSACKPGEIPGHAG